MDEITPTPDEEATVTIMEDYKKRVRRDKIKTILKPAIALVATVTVLSLIIKQVDQIEIEEDEKKDED